MNEMLVYYLKDTVTRIGTKDAEKQVSHSVTLHRSVLGLESLSCLLRNSLSNSLTRMPPAHPLVYELHPLTRSLARSLALYRSIT